MGSPGTLKGVKAMDIWLPVLYATLVGNKAR